MFTGCVDKCRVATKSQKSFFELTIKTNKQKKKKVPEDSVKLEILKKSPIWEKCRAPFAGL